MVVVLGGCADGSRPQVVVYTSQDQVYAEPILKTFEATTGIRVRVLYDSEAVKTVGLASRLLAEQPHPQCDVFWSNEEFRTRQLNARGVFRETNGWTAFGFRSRRWVTVTNLPPGVSAPRALMDLTNEVYRGRISLAYPLFGTTASHFLGLRNVWGAEVWEGWCRALAGNRPFLEPGNSHVPARLARGEAWIGLTDSDDLAAARREGVFAGVVFPLTSDMLLVPNTVAVIRGAPHPESAERLFQYLSGAGVAERLVEVGALEGVEVEGVGSGTLRPDWDRVVVELDGALEFLQTTFLK